MLDRIPGGGDPLALAATAALGLLVLLLLVRLASSSKSSTRAPKAAPKPPREPRGYTRAEVAAHASEGDCWLLLRNRGSDKLKVYDVTEYADQHPGGDAIFTHAGGDATEGFHGPQHPPTVFDLVDEYCIGWLLDE